MNRSCVIAVTLDCVRPDHLGCYGYRGVDTPNIDRVAREGLLCEQMVAQAPNTWVSHASIFTGCNPCTHGLRDPYTRISEQCVTLAEAFSRAGYATAAFPSHSLVGPATGFNRGFDHFALDLTRMKHDSVIGGTRYYREWDEIWTDARQWIDEQSQPVFIWLHYMPTHEVPQHMLGMPRDYLRRFSPFGQHYDAKISWADEHCVGTLLEFLETSGRSDDSALLLFADHGESLVATGGGTGRAMHNGDLRDEAVRIPLLLRAPGRVPAGRRIARQTRSIDIMPTLLGLADIEPPQSIEGLDLFGEPGNAEDTTDSGEHAYLENLAKHWLGVRTPRWKLTLTDVPEPAPGPTIVSTAPPTVPAAARELLRALGRSITARSQRLAASKPSPVNDECESHPPTSVENWRTAGLYDLAHDPDELHDVSAEYPDVVTQLRAWLDRALAVADSRGQADEISDEQREIIEERLRALGYVE